jgi:hypothetical protein
MAAGHQTVLDSTNTEAIIADALGEKPAGKPVEKVEVKEKKTDETDDVEGDDGLTPRQKREFTESMQKTIAKKHRQQKEAEEFAADQYNQRRLAEQRAEALEREANRLKTSVPAKPTELTEPVRENFKTDQEYQDARSDWRADVRFKELQAKAQQEQWDQVVANASNAVTRARDLVPDFEEKTSNADYIVPVGVQNLMLDSPLFAELGYHFTDHPEDLARLAILPPDRQKVEFRKLESTIQPFGPVVDGKQASKANGNGTEKPSQPSTETGKETVPSKPRVAAPITPLSAGSGTQVEKPASERTYADEKAAFQRKNRVNFSERKRH